MPGWLLFTLGYVCGCICTIGAIAFMVARNAPWRS